MVVVHYDILKGQDDWQLGMIATEGEHPGGKIPTFSWADLSKLCKTDYPVLWANIDKALRKAKSRPKQAQSVKLIGVEFLKKMLKKLQGRTAAA